MSEKTGFAAVLADIDAATDEPRLHAALAVREKPRWTPCSPIHRPWPWLTAGPMAFLASTPTFG